MNDATDDLLAFLATAVLTPHGILQGSSNQALLCTASAEGHDDTLVVYKAGQGERPLWDFPDGLYRREVAAYVVARALGWDIVPETVLRDGPFGPGAVQRFVHHDPSSHFLTLMPDRADDFRLAAAFDVVINNADRKSGHCLQEEETGRVLLVDHGVCFHVEDKLRTVIWDFSDEDLPQHVIAGLGRFLETPPDLSVLLDPGEQQQVIARAEMLRARGAYPRPPQDRHGVPWPLI